MTTIISAVSSHDPSEFSDLNKAQVKLKDILSRKRFLIVLNDVWNEKYELRDQLQAPFRMGSNGSRVIVTTRLKSVAKTMIKTPAGQSHFVYLKGLSDDECWRICKQHAGISDDPIDEIRDQVTKLSKGLPLAAKALGGLLRQSDRYNWTTILRNESWSEKTGVLPALRLSYYHLPPHLKRVFSYCSILPKDHEMVEEDVVLMWMAEGFIPESKNESMEHKAHSYFADLVSRSFFEPSSRSGKGYFIMHDLIHDLAHWVADDVCCRLQRNEDDDIKERTLFLSLTVNNGLPHFMKDKVGKKLRTFAMLPMPYYFKQVDALSFQKFQCLRVLRMSGIRMKELSSFIGNLKHLRLLDLSSNKLKELPESMSTLCNLQILILKSNRNLTKVLNMKPFVELRHLDIQECPLVEMPLGFKELRNLRTSRRFIITANSGRRIRDLENLKYLSGSLNISGLEHVMNSEDAKKARMHEKLDLEILKIFWETSELHQEQSSVEREVLHQLKPPESIKEVELHGYMGIAFLDWFGNPSFSNMVVIKLEECSKCERLPLLGQLPALEELKVHNMDGIKSIGLEFYGVGCPNIFSKLKIFEMKYMRNLGIWFPPTSLYSNKDYPYLKKLYITSCPLLQGDTPSFLPSLKILHIYDCNNLKVTLPSCRLLEELVLTRCRELNSIKLVIHCLRSVRLRHISSFSGVEGFWVPDIVKLLVLEIGCWAQDNPAKHGHIYVENCPKLLSWNPDVYEKLTKLTDVKLGNCTAWTAFLESKFPSSLKRLTIYEDKTINDISKFTQQSTCLLQELHLYGSSLITISNLPSTLQQLEIWGAKIEQPTKEWKLDLLTSLRKHVISNASNCKDAVELIPDPDLPLPPSLVELSIYRFKNLKSISFSTLPYLAKLSIWGCPQMRREGIHVPQGFVFNTEDGSCRVRLNYLFELR